MYPRIGNAAGSSKDQSVFFLSFSFLTRKPARCFFSLSLFYFLWFRDRQMLCSVYSVALLVSAFSFGVYTPLEVISDISLTTPYNVLNCILRVLRTTDVCEDIVQRLQYVSCKVANLLETDYFTSNVRKIVSDRPRSSSISRVQWNTFPFTTLYNHPLLFLSNCLSLPLNARRPNVDDSVPCRWRDPQYKHLSTSWLLVLNMAPTSMSSPDQ